MAFRRKPGSDTTARVTLVFIRTLRLLGMPFLKLQPILPGNCPHGFEGRAYGRSVFRYAQSAATMH